MHKRVFFALLFFVAGLCLAAGSSLSDDLRQVIVADIQGDVQVRVGNSWGPLHIGMILHERDQIQTDQGGSTVLFLDNNGNAGRVLLQENSRLTLGGLSQDPISHDCTTQLDLAIGEVLVHAEKLSSSSSFEVKTPTANAGVRGTIFSVWVSRQGDSLVRVLEGLVTVKELATKSEIFLREGQEVSVKPGRLEGIQAISQGNMDALTTKTAALFNAQEKPASGTGEGPGGGPPGGNPSPEPPPPPNGGPGGGGPGGGDFGSGGGGGPGGGAGGQDRPGGRDAGGNQNGGPGGEKGGPGGGKGGPGDGGTFFR